MTGDALRILWLCIRQSCLINARAIDAALTKCRGEPDLWWLILLACCRAVSSAIARRYELEHTRDPVNSDPLP